MKLYDPQLADQFIWQVSDKDDRTRPPKTRYAADKANQWEHSTLKHSCVLVDDTGHPMGKFDAQGFYCTYRPPIENVNGGLARYTRHPLAEEEAKTYERDLMYRRHGGSDGP